MTEIERLEKELAVAEANVRLIKKQLGEAIKAEMLGDPFEAFMTWAFSEAPGSDYNYIQRYTASSGRDFLEAMGFEIGRGTLDIKYIADSIAERWNRLEETPEGLGVYERNLERQKDGSWGWTKTNKVSMTKIDLLEWMEQLQGADFRTIQWDW